MKVHPDTNVVEMDCVEGKKGDSRSILTLTFRNCNLMLMFLLEYQKHHISHAHCIRRKIVPPHIIFVSMEILACNLPILKFQ